MEVGPSWFAEGGLVKDVGWFFGFGRGLGGCGVGHGGVYVVVCVCRWAGGSSIGGIILRHLRAFLECLVFFVRALNRGGVKV